MGVEMGQMRERLEVEREEWQSHFVAKIEGEMRGREVRVLFLYFSFFWLGEGLRFFLVIESL